MINIFFTIITGITGEPHQDQGPLEGANNHVTAYMDRINNRLSQPDSTISKVQILLVTII